MGLTETLFLSVSLCLIFSQMKTKSRIVSLYRRVRHQRPTTGGKAQVQILAYVVAEQLQMLNNNIIDEEKIAKN